jgi:hypothetical protein
LILVFSANNSLVYLRVDKEKNVSLATVNTNHLFVDVTKLYLLSDNPEKLKPEFEELSKKLRDKLLISNNEETVSYLQKEMSTLGMTYKTILDRDTI